MTGKQAWVAVRIDAAMQPLLRDDADDIAILTGMSDHMADFKTLIDTAKPGVMDELCPSSARSSALNPTDRPRASLAMLPYLRFWPAA